MTLLFVIAASIAAVACFAMLPREKRNLVAALLALPLVGWLAQPSVESLLRSKTDLLADQLVGRGCQFQSDGSRSLWPTDLMMDNYPSEIRCPMNAASEVARMQPSGAEARAILQRAFERALAMQPATFDTGDGVIDYADHLRAARAAAGLDAD